MTGRTVFGDFLDAAYGHLAEAGRLPLILARRIGEAFVAKAVDTAALRDFLIEEGAGP